MDTILQGIPRVICYINDMLVTGKTEEEHLQNDASAAQTEKTGSAA